jgi:hypothetical protein
VIAVDVVLFWLLPLLFVVSLGAVTLSIVANGALVSQMKLQEPELFAHLGSPRYIGYQWTAWPKNRAYSEWLRAQTDRKGPYWLLVRRIRVCRLIFHFCWIATLVIVLGLR